MTRAVLVPGAVFSTPYESGCVVVEPPTPWGSFLARDSDGVVCEFHVDMVTEVAP